MPTVSANALSTIRGEKQMSEEINNNRRRFLGNAAMTVAAAQLSLIGSAKA
jgi:nitrous oxide reductase